MDAVGYRSLFLPQGFVLFQIQLEKQRGVVEYGIAINDAGGRQLWSGSTYAPAGNRVRRYNNVAVVQVRVGDDYAAGRGGGVQYQSDAVARQLLGVLEHGRCLRIRSVGRVARICRQRGIRSKS